MKIGCTDSDAPVPKPLLNSCVPSEILFWLQRLERSGTRVKAKNLVLTARRTETGRNARVQRRVGLVDLVTPGNPICPNIVELIEMIEASDSDENENMKIPGVLMDNAALFDDVNTRRTL